jgi:hypothetical protein
MIIGYRAWIVAIGDNGLPQLRSFNRIDVTRRWPYLGEGDAHFTMGRCMGGDTAGRDPNGIIKCDDKCPDCRGKRSMPKDWTPDPCLVPGCPEDRPRITNTLGFHAFKTMAQLKDAVAADFSPPDDGWVGTIAAVWPEAIGFVLAQVEMWGYVVEHATGWRGEYSRPYRLLEFIATHPEATADTIDQLECLYLNIEPMEKLK